VFWSGISVEQPYHQFTPSPAPVAAHPAPAVSGVSLALTIVMWIAWLGVIVVADFLGFLMFAFADSPGAGKAAQMMIAPAFVWFAITFVAGVALLLFRRWWTIALAFVLAISPPFVIFAGYNLFDGVGGPSSGGGGGVTVNPAASTPTSPPPVDARIPPGGFKPPPMKTREQPDFQEAIRRATQPSSRPARDAGS
jgi:hypothetical protein